MSDRQPFGEAADKEIRINPRPDAAVDADKLYVLVRAGNARPDAEITHLLRRDLSTSPVRAVPAAG